MEADNDNLVFYLQPDFKEAMLRDDRSWDEAIEALDPVVRQLIFPKLFVDAVFC